MGHSILACRKYRLIAIILSVFVSMPAYAFTLDFADVGDYLYSFARFALQLLVITLLLFEVVYLTASLSHFWRYKGKDDRFRALKKIFFSIVGGLASLIILHYFGLMPTLVNYEQHIRTLNIQ